MGPVNWVTVSVPGPTGYPVSEGAAKDIIHPGIIVSEGSAPGYPGYPVQPGTPVSEGVTKDTIRSEIIVSEGTAPGYPVHPGTPFRKAQYT